MVGSEVLHRVRGGPMENMRLAQRLQNLLHKIRPIGEVAGRGCSTKEKMYYVHCEAHEMEELEEKFCYCSFNYCNTAIKKTPSCFLLLALVSSCLLLPQSS